MAGSFGGVAPGVGLALRTLRQPQRRARESDLARGNDKGPPR